MKYVFLFLICAFCILACSERSERIETKLESYLQEDLKFMVAETMKATGNKKDLLDTPYYRIKDFRLFSGAEAEIYSAYAEVDYFIYKDMALHEKRKYRYDVSVRQWDRYLKTLYFGKDTIHE